MRGFLNRLHQRLARSSFAARACVLARNQANCVIAWHLGESSDGAQNGEFQVVEALLPHCAAFVDVGANVGDWSGHILSRRQARGILYEPSVECAGLLQKEFAGRDVRIRNVAVGKEKGTVSFVEEENCGAWSAVAETYQGTSGTARDVPMVTLDDELLAEDFPVDYLKIDTEGYDLNVLKGAARLLRAGRVRFIQFEYNSHWLAARSTLHEAKSFLENEMGYRLVLIRSTGLHPLAYDFWGEYYRYSNFLAYRAADAPLLQGLLREKI